MRARQLSIGLATVVLVGLFAMPAAADNIRPFVPAAGLSEVQSRLDAIYGCVGCVNALTDQSTTGLWQLPGLTAGGTLPTLVFQSGDFSNLVSFGLWDGNTLNRLEVFNGVAGPGSMASVTWAGGDPNTATVYPVGSAIGNSGAINRYDFGFYIGSPQGLFYSLDALNPGGAQMLAYSGPGGRTALFFEDLNCAVGCDNFIDLVVSTESIIPTPEPGSLALLGIALVGLAGFRKTLPVKSALRAN